MHKSLVTRFATKDVDAEARTFTGLASTWDLDLGGDIIRRGAFKRTLDHWKSSGRPLPLLDSHQAFGSVRSAIGKMEAATETDTGLEATFSVIDGVDGDEVMRRIKAGLVDGLSIGYEPVKVEWPDEADQRKGVYRYLDEVKLREVSVVIFPMNEAARIDTASVKSLLLKLDGLEEPTDEEVAELRSIRDHITRVLAKTEPAPDVYQGTEELATRLNHLFADRLARRIGTLSH